MPLPRVLIVALAALIVAAACGSVDASESAETDAEQTAMVAPGGIRLIDAVEGRAIQTDPPDGLVILDVRTPEEFAEGHLDGAIMLDFHEDDFADRLAELDPDLPYLLYCRSGNRSGQTAAMMRELGFTDVADVDGGIQAWAAAGNPTLP